MERLTERWCKGMVRIKGCSTAYLDKERKGAHAASAIVRLAAYEDTGMTPEEITGLCSMDKRAKMADLLRLEEYQEIGSIDHFRELAQAEKDGRPPVTPRAKTYDAHTVEAEYLLGVLWNGLHNADGMDAKAADRVAEIAHEKDRVQPAATPRNDPLTLEELREMDGEPVWNDTRKKYVLVDAGWWDGIGRTVDAQGKWRPLDDRYYRHRPEGGAVVHHRGNCGGGVGLAAEAALGGGTAVVLPRSVGSPPAEAERPSGEKPEPN